MKTQRIAVIGLGLIGGSIARRLKKRSNLFIMGLDINKTVCEKALDERAVDEIIRPENLIKAQLIILALSPEQSVKFLSENKGYVEKGTIVTDVCGVKRYIVKECSSMCDEIGAYFIGGHPMAGKEKSGFENSDSSLFEGASYIITPTDDTPEGAVDEIKNIADILGCKNITVTNPENHDRMIAFTSQLPHVLAGAYIKSPVSLRHSGYSAGSYRDVSRVASVDENLWSDLFLHNSDFLCEEIGLLIKNLSECKDAIETENRENLKEILKKSRIIKEADKTAG